MDFGALAPGEGAQHQLRNGVDQDGGRQQHEAQLEKRVEIEVARRLGEFVGDDARQRVAGRESER